MKPQGFVCKPGSWSPLDSCPISELQILAAKEMTPLLSVSAPSLQRHPLSRDHTVDWHHPQKVPGLQPNRHLGFIRVLQLNMSMLTRSALWGPTSATSVQARPQHSAAHHSLPAALGTPV